MNIDYETPAANLIARVACKDLAFSAATDKLSEMDPKLSQDYVRNVLMDLKCGDIKFEAAVRKIAMTSGKLFRSKVDRRGSRKPAMVGDKRLPANACSRCRHPTSKVINSRTTSKLLRRRKCMKCGNRWTTEEVVVDDVG